MSSFRRILGAGVAVLLATSLSGCLPLALLTGVEPGVPAGSEADDWEYTPVAIGACPWESAWTGATLPPAEPADHDLPWADAVAATEAVALDEELFWDLIESAPDELAWGDLEELSSQLAGCSFEDILAFEARLTLTLAALDGPENRDWFEANDPSGFGWASDDVFLYARCASVLGGRDSWAAAVAEGTLDWGDDAPDVEGNAESLLYVASDAAFAQGVDFGDYYDLVWERIPISYESGSNTALWP